MEPVAEPREEPLMVTGIAHPAPSTDATDCIPQDQYTSDRFIQQLIGCPVTADGQHVNTTDAAALLLKTEGTDSISKEKVSDVINTMAEKQDNAFRKVAGKVTDAWLDANRALWVSMMIDNVGPVTRNLLESRTFAGISISDAQLPQGRTPFEVGLCHVPLRTACYVQHASPISRSAEHEAYKLASRFPSTVTKSPASTPGVTPSTVKVSTASLTGTQPSIQAAPSGNSNPNSSHYSNMAAAAQEAPAAAAAVETPVETPAQAQKTEDAPAPMQVDDAAAGQKAPDMSKFSEYIRRADQILRNPNASGADKNELMKLLLQQEQQYKEKCDQYDKANLSLEEKNKLLADLQKKTSTELDNLLDSAHKQLGVSKNSKLWEALNEWNPAAATEMKELVVTACRQRTTDIYSQDTLQMMNQMAGSSNFGNVTMAPQRENDPRSGAGKQRASVSAPDASFYDSYFKY